MASLNKIILVGRLTTNPEIRTTMDAVPMTRFQLAVERMRFGAAPKETDFVDVIAWRNNAEYASQNLSKGQMALVEGRIQNRSFETKEGVKRYVTEVVANNVVVLEGKRAAKPRAAEPEPVKTEDEGGYLGEDLPF